MANYTETGIDRHLDSRIEAASSVPHDLALTDTTTPEAPLNISRPAKFRLAPPP